MVQRNGANDGRQRVAIYCRVSTADQDNVRQERDLKEYAERAGYEAVEVFAVLVVAGLRLRRAGFASEARSSRRGAAPAHADRIRWRFRLVNVAQGLGIGIAVFACVRLRRPELIPAAGALVVGLHFFPLATLFRVPLYHATGAALCSVAVATPLVAAPLGAQTAAWQVVPGVGAAVILWATSAVLVVGGLGSIRRGA